MLAALSTSLWALAPFLPEPFEGGKRLALAINSLFALGLLLPRARLKPLFPALLVLALLSASTLLSASLETAFWGRRPFRDGLFGLLPALAFFACCRLAGASLYRRMAFISCASALLLSLTLVFAGSNAEGSLAWVRPLLGEPAVWIGLSPGRPGGALGNAAYGGIVLAALSVLALGRALEPGSGLARLGWILTGLGLVLGSARTGTFAAVLGWILGLLAALAASGRFRLRAGILPLLGGMVLLLAFPWQRPLSEGGMRLHLARASFRLWKAKFWLGWGPEGFSTAYPSLSWTLAERRPFAGLPRSSESLWTDLAVSFGFLGLILVLFFLARTLAGAFRRGESGRLGALTALLAGNSFHRFSLPAQVLASALVLPRRDSFEPRRSPPLLRSLLGLLLALASAEAYVRAGLAEARIRESEFPDLPLIRRLQGLDRAARFRPRDPEILAARARVQSQGRSLEDLEAARKSLRELALLDPAAPSVNVDLARLSREIYLATRIPGDLDEARKNIFLAMGRSTAGQESLQEAAAIFMETGEDKVLASVLERARLALPGESWPLAYIGYLQIRKGDAAGAKLSLTEALRKGFHGDPVAEGFTRLNLSVLLFQTGDSRGALSEAQRAAELIPEDASVHYQLGLLHLAQKNTSLAEADFQRCLIYNPSHGEAAEMLEKINKAKPRFLPLPGRSTLTP